MAPNIIGNSFILAETTIEPNNAKSTRILPSKNDTSLHEIQKVKRLTIFSGFFSFYFFNHFGFTFFPLQINHSTKRFFNFKKSDIVWRNAIAFIYLHVAASYAIYLLASGHAQIYTFLLGKCAYRIVS